MATATSLRDLLVIRDANRTLIDSINGQLGSAVGIKNAEQMDASGSSEPAVIIFVPEKIDPKWLPPGQEIPRILQGPNGLSCPTDVVIGSKRIEHNIPAFLPGQEEPIFISSFDLQEQVPLSSSKLQLLERLRGWTSRITPGSQLAATTIDGQGYFGTLGCFVTDRTTGSPGLLTNLHVADRLGNTLKFASLSGRTLARVARMQEFISDEERFPGVINEQNARYRVDCAFARLEPNIDRQEIDSRIPVLNNDGEIELITMGAPLELDIDTMGPLGQSVIGVGRTRSFQRGKIVAFAYEHLDQSNEARYTDYLIIGEDGDTFSDRGDSGKIILTDEINPRPVALLWGGWWERLRSTREQENWTYAIDINLVLRLLDIEILT